MKELIAPVLLLLLLLLIFRIGYLIGEGFFKFRMIKAWHQDEKMILYYRIHKEVEILVGGDKRTLWYDLKDRAMRYNDAKVTVFITDTGQVSNVFTCRAFRTNWLSDKNTILKKSWLQKAILGLKPTPADPHPEIKFFQSLINQIANQDKGIAFKEMFPKIFWPW